MRYGSVCSGIEAASVAWLPLGFTCAFVAEIDPFCCEVLACHYPEVPNLGDINAPDFIERARAAGPIDVLVGGPPCQAFSIAGLRGGLADARSNLTLRYLAVVDALRPRWLVYENVPGILSSTSHDAPDPCRPAVYLDGDDGPADGTEIVVADEYDSDEDHAFSCFLAGLSELRYGWSYGSLNAEYFGLAQRRERVFVVGYPGAWQPAAAVLLDPESMSGHPPPSREEGQRTTGTLGARTSAGGGFASGRGVEQTGDSRGQDCVIPILEAGARTGKSASDPRAGMGVGDAGDPMYTLDEASQYDVFATTGDGYWQEGAGTLRGRSQESHEHLIASTGDISHCLNAGGMGRIDYETETLVTHALRAEGFDASEDGTGRGIPLVPEVTHSLTRRCGTAEEDGTGRGAPLVTTYRTNAAGQIDPQGDLAAALTSNTDQCSQFICSFEQNSMGGRGTLGWSEEEIARPVKPQSDHQMLPTVFDTTQVTSKANRSNPQPGDPCHPLVAAGDAPLLAFSCKDSGLDAGEVSPTLRAMEFDGSHANGGGQVAVCIPLDLRNACRGEEPMAGMRVRRLTPFETAALQGFPDTYCHIPRKPRKIEPDEAAHYISHGVECWQDGEQWMTKAAADGNIYRAHGNSMAVPCMIYLGRQIQAVDECLEQVRRLPDAQPA